MCTAVPHHVLYPHHVLFPARAYSPVKHSYENDAYDKWLQGIKWRQELKNANDDYILYLAWAGFAAFAGYSIYQMYRMFKEHTKKWHDEDLVQE
jgi:hypothetical protein